MCVSFAPWRIAAFNRSIEENSTLVKLHHLKTYVALGLFGFSIHCSNAWLVLYCFAEFSLSRASTHSSSFSCCSVMVFRASRINSRAVPLAVRITINNPLLHSKVSRVRCCRSYSCTFKPRWFRYARPIKTSRVCIWNDVTHIRSD